MYEQSIKDEKESAEMKAKIKVMSAANDYLKTDAKFMQN